jgi:hypothetical protein
MGDTPKRAPRLCAVNVAAGHWARSATGTGVRLVLLVLLVGSTGTFSRLRLAVVPVEYGLRCCGAIGSRDVDDDNNDDVRKDGEKYLE